MARFASARMFLLFMLLAWITGACALIDEDLSDVGEPKLTLAMSVKSMEEGRSVTTKMSQTITQASGTFRGIEQIYVIPFDTASDVSSQDSRLGGNNVLLENPGISSTGLVSNNNGHLFENAVMPMAMNHVLVYGKAIDAGTITSQKGKHANGVLTPSGLEDPISSDDISFCLEPVLDTASRSDLLKQADSILTKLNNLTTLILQSKNPQIVSIFDIIKRENQILACSYPVFNCIRSDVQSALLAIPNDPATTADKILISAAINSFSNVLDGTGDSFPSSYGIPEGTLGFWWNGNEFIRLINGVNISLVEPFSYSYPPSLWYYSNSPIKTSENDSVRSEYKTSNNWDDILAHYPGTRVSSSTQSVAIVDQLQYGVGMLELDLNTPGTAAASLAGGCPLKGIIIGDQKDVDFGFRPMTTASRYIYDNVVGDLSIGQTGVTVQTLVLQTVKDEPVHFALEFQNTTRNILYCQQGEILPWCNFYLAGILKEEEATQPGGETLDCIFTKDHITRVSVTIESLRNAYNTVPDLHDPELEIGIVADMKWVPLTPQSIRMNL